MQLLVAVKALQARDGLAAEYAGQQFATQYFVFDNGRNALTAEGYAFLQGPLPAEVLLALTGGIGSFRALARFARWSLSKAEQPAAQRYAGVQARAGFPGLAGASGLANIRLTPVSHLDEESRLVPWPTHTAFGKFRPDSHRHR